MPRLCILTQYFPPEMGAPQARLSELGERLIESGWEVEALTALPNYPTGRVFPEYRPTQACVENIGRIRTARVPLVPAKGGFARRLVCYFSFVASACRHGPRLCRKPDLMFVESPPLFIGYAARYLPEAGDEYRFAWRIEAVNDPIGSVNDFSGDPIIQLWNQASPFRKCGQRQGRINQEITEPLSRLWIVERDVSDDLFEVLDGSGRDDYLTSHEGIIWRTSSAGRPSPRSVCSNPWRTPAMNSISRAMS
jgi:colanic acid biosynthesis glycosyl transferase WcaI